MSEIAPAKAAPKRKKATKKSAADVAPAVALPVVELAEVEVPAVEVAPLPPRLPSRDEVARRAYEIWLSRGGTAFENWIEAEQQLLRP